jgi:hypothetical protein
MIPPLLRDANVEPLGEVVALFDFFPLGFATVNGLYGIRTEKGKRYNWRAKMVQQDGIADQ